MGLVGVAGVGREGGQVVSGLTARWIGVDPGDEPAETEHALQGLGAVADSRVAAPAQLPHARPDFRGDVFGPCSRVGQQDSGLIAGTLHARGVGHPWLDRATEVMWTLIDALAEPGGYDMFGVLRFLQHVPDRDRAREVFGRVGPLIIDRDLVASDPETPGEVHFPLDFAPEPDSLARELFDEATIKAHLDHLAQAQRDDGGWMFNWLAWSPAAEREWRGFLTVDALRILRANGYLAYP